MDRLLLPRVRLEPGGVEVPIPESVSPLPRWQKLPMDSKFPVNPAPRGEVTFVTTKMCQPAYKSKQHKDFDLTDPYNRTMKSEYVALHDPSLKAWFAKPHIRKKLIEQNLITEQGNISCSVRDFNDYRYFLRHQAVIGSHKSPTRKADSPVQQRRERILQEKKLKAEVFGVEVKYKLLKAKQTNKDIEDEKRRKFEEKQQRQEERRKELEQSKLMRSRSYREYEKLRQREENTRRMAEKKLLQFETEAQRRLNIIDYIREQRFQQHDQKIKEAWRKKREYQMKMLAEEEKQRLRVEKQKQVEKRKYEEEMMKRLTKDQVSRLVNKEDKERIRSDKNEIFEQRLNHVLKDTEKKTLWKFENTQDSKRRASFWIVEEVLQRLGLSSEVPLNNLLSLAVSKAVRKLETASVICEEQQLLSSIVHLMIRQVKDVYLTRDEDFLAVTDNDDDEDKEERPVPPSLFGDLDVTEETEKAVRISMLATLDFADQSSKTWKNPVTLGTAPCLPRMEESDHPRDQEQLFARRMRIGETDAFFLDKELSSFLELLQNENLDMKQMKSIITLFLKLAHHETIATAEPCGPMERNPDGRIVYAFSPNSSKTNMEDQSRSKLQLLSEIYKSATNTFMDAPDPGSKPDGELAAAEGRKSQPYITENLGQAKKNDFLSRAEEERFGFSEEKDDLSSRADNPHPARIDDLPPGKIDDLPPARIDDLPPARIDDLPPARIDDLPPARIDDLPPARIDDLPPARIDDLPPGKIDDPEASADDNVDAKNEEEPQIPEESDAEETGMEENVIALEDDVTEDVNAIPPEADFTENDAQDIVTEEKTRLAQDEPGDENQNKVQDDSETEEEEGGQQPEEVQDTEEHLEDESEKSLEESERPKVDADDPEATEEYDDTQAEHQEEVEINNQETNEIASPRNEVVAQEQDAVVDSNKNSDSVKEKPASNNVEGTGNTERDATITSGVLESTEGTASKQRTANEELRFSVDYDDNEDYENEEEDNGETMEDSEERRKRLEEEEEERHFEKSVADDNLVMITRHFLSKIQERGRLEGIGFPPSRFHRFIVTLLSKIWRKEEPSENHVFGKWLGEEQVSDVAKRLVFCLGKKHLPACLLKKLATGIMDSLMLNMSDYASYFSDSLVRVVLNRFLADLQKENVSMIIVERTLKAALEAFDDYETADVDFMLEVFLLECLEKAEDMVADGVFNKRMDFINAVFDVENFPREKREYLYTISWKDFIHRAKATIQLDALNPEKRLELREILLKVTDELLTLDADDNVHECVQRLKTRMSGSSFRTKLILILTSNVVNALLPTIQQCQISSMTLLPAALNTSQSANATTTTNLGFDTLGESIVVLLIDKLARVMGTNKIKPAELSCLASSVVDLLVSDFQYLRSDLQDTDMAGVFDSIVMRFRCREFGFKESKQFLSSLIRPYLALVLRTNKDLRLAKVTSTDLGVDQISSFVGLITQVFLTFVAGIVARMNRSGLKVKKRSDVQVFYVWKTIAILAGEAKSLLQEVVADSDQYPGKGRVQKSDSYVVRGFVYTMVDKGQDGTVPESVHAAMPGLVNSFLLTLIERFKHPGYIPDKDGKADQGSSSTPPEVTRVVKREVISACREIGESLVTPQATQLMSSKMADYVASTVFVLEKIVSNYHEKLWALRHALLKKELDVPDVVDFIIGQTRHGIPALKNTLDDAVQLVTGAILEMEELLRSVRMLNKMVESISRMGMDAGGVRGQPHNVLSVVTPLLLTRLMKSCLLTILRTLSVLVQGKLDKALWQRRRNTVNQLEKMVTVALMVTAHNDFTVLKQQIEDCITPQGLWTPGCVAGTEESSVIDLPIETVDKVFARLEGIMDNFQSAKTSFEDGTQYEDKGSYSAKDICEIIISRVMTSIVYRVEVGSLPCLRVNDLVRGQSSQKISTSLEHAPSTSLEHVPSSPHDRSANKKMDQSGNKILNPLLCFEQDVSTCLYEHLLGVISGVDQHMKKEVEGALVINEDYDNKIRARVIIDSLLGKIRSNQKNKTTFLTDFNLAEKQTHHKQTPNGSNSRAAPARDLRKHASVNVEAFSKTSSTSLKKVPLSAYIKMLFNQIFDEKLTCEDEYHDKAVLINEIVNACYNYHASFVETNDAKKEISSDRLQSDSIKILITEMVLEELLTKVRRCKKGANESVFKRTAHPYLFSQEYHDPDPLGPYYAEVIDRERRLSNFIKVETTAAAKTSPRHVAAMIKGDNSVETKVSSSCQSDRLRSEHSRKAGKSVAQNPVDVLTSKRIVNRVTEWRKNICLTSTANSLESAKSTSSIWKQKTPQKVTMQKNAEVKDARDFNKQKSAVTASELACSKQNLKVENKTAATKKQQTVKDENKNKNVDAVKDKTDHADVGKKPQAVKKETTKSPENDAKLKMDKERAKKQQQQAIHKAKLRAEKLRKKQAGKTIPGIQHQQRKIEVFYHVTLKPENLLEPDPQNGTVGDICRGEVDGNIQVEVKLDIDDEVGTSVDKINEVDDKTQITNEENAVVEDGGHLQYLLSVLLSLVAEELPKEVEVLRQIFPMEELCRTSMKDLVDLLSVVEFAQEKYDVGRLTEVGQVLRGEVSRTETGHRLVGAFNNIYRNVEGGMVTDTELLQKAGIVSGEDKIDMETFRLQVAQTLQEIVTSVSAGYGYSTLLGERWKEVIELMEAGQVKYDMHEPGENENDDNYHDDDFEDDREDLDNYSDDLEPDLEKNDTAEKDDDDVDCNEKNDKNKELEKEENVSKDEEMEEDKNEDNESVDENRVDVENKSDDENESDVDQKERLAVDDDKSSSDDDKPKCSGLSSWSSIKSDLTSLSGRSEGSRKREPRRRKRKRARPARSHSTVSGSSKDSSEHSERNSSRQEGDRSRSSSDASSPATSRSPRNSARLDETYQSQLEVAADEGTSVDPENYRGGDGDGRVDHVTTNTRTTLSLDKVDRELAAICELPDPCLIPGPHAAALPQGAGVPVMDWMDDIQDAPYDDDDYFNEENDNEEYDEDDDDDGEPVDPVESSRQEETNEDSPHGPSEDDDDDEEEEDDASLSYSDVDSVKE